MTDHEDAPPSRETDLPAAVLFDIDGTLVDSNYLHVDAWQQAFAAAGSPVDAWRVHRLIGLDSDALLDELAGNADADLDRDALSVEQSRIYRGSAARLRRFAGARETLVGLDAAGVTVVLATSAPGDELEILLGVLDLPAAPITTNADDVEEAKPHPGVIEVALERAGVDAADALMVGDAEWDMRAAGRAGVRAIGVRSGGIGADELTGAGAQAVYDDVDALRRAWHLD